MGNSDASNLYARANWQDKMHPTAVVQYMGYNAPEQVRSDARNPSLARNGAEFVSRDFSGLISTHNSNIPYDTTVIGHSYGSTTVADACVLRMHPTNIVLIGSPGTDWARTYKDLSGPDQHVNVFVGADSKDPVSKSSEPETPLKIHMQSDGKDPADAGFVDVTKQNNDPYAGGVRFQAEYPTKGIIPLAESMFGVEFDQHSHYYDRNSESLDNMSRIVTGDGRSVSTAAPRYAGSLGDQLFRGTNWHDPEKGTSPNLTSDGPGFKYG